MSIAAKINPSQRQRRRRPPNTEQTRWMRAKLSRWTNLDLDFARLDVEAQHALLSLIEMSSQADDPAVDKFNPADLGKRDLKKLEALTERAAGVEPGMFARERDDAQFRAQVSEIVREGLVSNPTRDQEGAFFKEVRAQMSHPTGRTCLTAEHLAVLTGLLGVIFSADPPVGSDMRVERGADGETELVWRRNYSLFGVCDSSRISSRSDKILRHLEANRWLELTGGAEVTIKLGSRAKKVFGGDRG